MRTIRTLSPSEFTAYREHLLRLSAEDRRLRFGAATSDTGIAAFVERLSVFDTQVVAAFDNDGRVVGAVQLARIDWTIVECAFTVESSFRHRGVGTALMKRALLWARNRSVRHVRVRCLRENLGMRRLAAKAGLSFEAEDGEIEGTAITPLPSLASLWWEAATEIRGYVAEAHRRLRSPGAAMALAGS